MNRRVASFLALLVLLGLTAVTWALFEDGAGPSLVTGVAAAKATVIGVVFLELDRVHRGWLVLGMSLVVGIAAGIVLLLP